MTFLAATGIIATEPGALSGVGILFFWSKRYRGLLHKAPEDREDGVYPKILEYVHLKIKMIT